MHGHDKLVERPWTLINMICQAIIPAFITSIHYGLFFRDVITMNYFSRSSRMLIGPAADEAANLYEAAEWIGISISPSTAAALATENIGNKHYCSKDIHTIAVFYSNH
jgi:hypothetical protein